MKLLSIVTSMLEIAAKIAVVPTDRRATKIINYLKKHYAAKTLKNYYSNPYDSVQTLTAIVTPARGEKFVKELQEQGWRVKQKKFTGRDYKNSMYYDALFPDTGARITITQYSDKDVISKKKSCHITAYGDKKAKLSTLPYYD